MDRAVNIRIDPYALILISKDFAYSTVFTHEYFLAMIHVSHGTKAQSDAENQFIIAY